MCAYSKTYFAMLVLFLDANFEEIVDEFSQFLDNFDDGSLLTLPSHSFTIFYHKSKGTY